MIPNIFRIFFLCYVGVYISIHHNMQSVMFMVGGMLDIIEIILTGFHFYASTQMIGTMYTTHATGIAILLGDIFHIKNILYFSIGDIIMFIGFWLTL